MFCTGATVAATGKNADIVYEIVLVGHCLAVETMLNNGAKVQ